MKKCTPQSNKQKIFATTHLTHLLCLAILLSFNATVLAEQVAQQLIEKPSIEDLGKGRYRIGSIIVNKPEKSFKVSGEVLRLKPPLEFLAVTKGGMKGYESLLELDVNAFEFNLACILIGLNKEKSKAPEFHFSEEPAKGDPVSIWLSWEENGNVKRIPAGAALLQDKKTVSNNWVYTASGFTPSGEYLASIDGTLVGFVHDPASIIEHREGLGLGNYGAVSGNTATLPAVGSKILFTIERKK